MLKALVRPFKFEMLDISALLKLSSLLLEKVFTPAKVQAVGIEEPCKELSELHTKYADILKHNPTLLETEPLSKDVARLRTLLGVFGDSLRVAGITGDADTAEKVRVVSNIAAPYLKNRNRSTMMSLLGNAQDLCDALGSDVNAPKVNALGLTGQLAAIKELEQQSSRRIDLRGEEKEYRKKLGTASKARSALQKQYRFIFTSVLSTLYHITTDNEVKNALTEMLDHINATLDSFRYLTGGGTGDGTDDYGDPHKPGLPGDPDTGPADPPNGGTYIDPNA